MSDQQVFLTPAELSSRWRGRVTVKTLAEWRLGREKVGPKFVRVGRSRFGAVLYPLADVIEYEKTHMHFSTQSEVKA